MDGQERFTLAEIGGGATVERFDMAMQEVLDNIQDVNTDPKKARTVTLKLTIKPSEDRGSAGSTPPGLKCCDLGRR